MSYNNTDDLNVAGLAPGSIDGLGLKQLVPGALGNYIGPGWSNGELQESVEWGGRDPIDRLDLAAYYHDSAYAKYKDARHRAAADRRFYADTKDIEGPLAEAARNAVLYGNHTGRRASDLVKNAQAGAAIGGIPGALAGVVYSGLKGGYELARGLHGGWEQDDKDIDEYFKTDPHKRADMFKIGTEPGEIEPWNKPIIDRKAETSDKLNTRKPRKFDESVVAKRAFDRAKHARMLHDIGRPVELDAQAAVPPMRGVSMAHAATNEQDVVVHDPRSFFQRVFKRGRKKKTKKALESAQKDLIQKQREHLQHHLKLKHEAEHSQLKQPSGPDWNWSGYQGRAQHILSNKLSAQQKGR